MRVHLSYPDIYTYVERRVYPASIRSKGDKSNFRRCCKKYVPVGKELYYKSKKGNLLVVQSKEEQQRIIGNVHRGIGDTKHARALAAHIGRDAAIAIVNQRFFWHNYREDIGEYIKSCEICQKTSPRFPKMDEKLHPVAIPSVVMKQIGVDICQLPEVDSYKYLIVAVDYFSKWPEAEPLKENDATAVAAFLYKLICRHGFFSIQINDQGREFVNNISQELHRLSGIKQRVCSSYHPQVANNSCFAPKTTN